MQARFIEQGREGILKSRAVEDRLVTETWVSPNGYDLHPKLKGLNIPALVITGDHDSFPSLPSTLRLGVNEFSRPSALMFTNRR